MHPGRLSALTCLTVALAAGTTLADDAKPAQQKKTFEMKGNPAVKLNYLLYLPKGYDKSEKKWPLILFLHGAGERGNNVEMVKRHGPPKIVEKKDLPFIVVSPQSPAGGRGRGFGWNTKALNALLDDVIAHYRVDTDRIYLTGLSMGGFGTWKLAAEHPERFAAIAPICGGGNPADAEKLKNLPVWVFHGAKDPVVPIKRSRDMVNALKKAGDKEVKFTTYPNAGHDSWTQAYNDPELYKWFLEHKKSGEDKSK